MADGQQTALVKAPIGVGGKVAAIIPQSFDEAWRCAQVLSASGMAPRDIDTPEKVMATIMAGAEIGMAPFQALQSFAVINGRPALWGDGMLGVVRARGVKVSESMAGEGDTMTASCTVTRPDTGEEVTRTFSVADAKAAKLWEKRGRDGRETPWVTYPKRMLQMRARAWAIRDCCADMLRGLQMAEEAQDVEVVRNEPLNADGIDQRPADEIEEGRSAFIFGEAWNLVEQFYLSAFDTSPDADALEKTWKSFERKYWVGKRRCISELSYAGMAEMYERAKIRLEDGATALAKIADAIDRCTDLHSLEAWRADAATETRWAKLAGEQLAAAQAQYEAAQERFAEQEHEALRKSREAAGEIVPA